MSVACRVSGNLGGSGLTSIGQSSFPIDICTQICTCDGQTTCIKIFQASFEHGMGHFGSVTIAQGRCFRNQTCEMSTSVRWHWLRTLSTGLCCVGKRPSYIEGARQGTSVERALRSVIYDRYNTPKHWKPRDDHIGRVCLCFCVFYETKPGQSVEYM